jgi:hypothetical protein
VKADANRAPVEMPGPSAARSRHHRRAGWLLPAASIVNVALAAPASDLLLDPPDRLGSLVIGSSTLEDVVAVLGEPDNAGELQIPGPRTLKILKYSRLGIEIHIVQDLRKRIVSIELSQNFSGTSVDGLRIGMPIDEAKAISLARFGKPFAASDIYGEWFIHTDKGSYNFGFLGIGGKVINFTLGGKLRLSAKQERENNEYFAQVSAQVQAAIAASKAKLAAAEAPRQVSEFASGSVPSSRELTLLPAAHLRIATAYKPGVTTWDQFVADGWPTRSPHNGDLGIVRMSGTLMGELTVVLGVVEGNPGFVVNPPEIALGHLLQMMEFGMGINFEAEYFESEPIELPSGRRMGGENMARPVCQLSFKLGAMTENTCAELKE